VQLLLIVLLGLMPACMAKQGPAPSSVEPTGAEPVVFVEVPFVAPRVEPESGKSSRPEQPPPAEDPSPEQQQQAKLSFQAGVELYEAGDIAGAVEKFREAYAYVPLPALLFNIARGQEQLGDVVGACETYETARSDPQADQTMRDAASERIIGLNCP
jgi:tetratricopeptide (TPR) repeat protein